LAKATWDNFLMLALFFCLPHFAVAQQDTIFRTFNLSQTDNRVLISFTIRGGVTCSGVKIERSDDGTKYSEVYEFAGVCGSLNTDESYAYTDTQPLINQTSWYRLDLGSLGLYSGTRTIRYIQYNSSRLVVFPTPCRDDCEVFFSNPREIEHEAVLYDRSGKTISRKFISENRWKPGTTSLPGGIYFFRILREGEIRHSGKLLIL
jgi:hypothetical protein